MVIPRDPEGSKLIWLLSEMRMPHRKKTSAYNRDGA